LAAAIIQLLQDPAKLKAFGSAARQTAVREYGLAPIVEQALKTYEVARQRHSKDHALYGKAPEELVQDLDILLGLYHSRLHKFGEDLSLRYRSRKWVNMIVTRPRLLLGFLGLSLARLFTCWLPAGAGIKKKLATFELRLQAKCR